MKGLHKIKEIVDETPSVKTFFLDGKIDMKPGQFFMVWLPGVDEKPFVLSYTGNKAGVTIRKSGRATKAFHKLKAGDEIGLRGPFGNGFTLHKGKVAIVAGGIGMIPLKTLAEKIPDAVIISGAKTKDELIFSSGWKKVFVCTDDGSAGEKMFSPYLFEKLLKEEKFDFVYTCGPEMMIKKVLEICLREKIPMEASLERYMKCGLGLCGSCVCGDRLVCKDGPVFSNDDLVKMKDFGKSAKLKNGKKVSLKEYYSWKQK